MTQETVKGRVIELSGDVNELCSITLRLDSSGTATINLPNNSKLMKVTRIGQPVELYLQIESE